MAGSGVSGFGGDGGPATAAVFGAPWGVAVDGLGNLYIADAPGQRIRRVGVDGIITTIAGTGAFGFNGDGGAATAAQLYYPRGVALDAAGAVYVADSYNQRVRRIDPGPEVAGVAVELAVARRELRGIDAAARGAAHLRAAAQRAVLARRRRRRQTAREPRHRADQSHPRLHAARIRQRYAITTM